MIQAADFMQALRLTELSPSTVTEWDITSTELNRPGIQFCGFYEGFAFERPQVIGRVEMTYLESLDHVQRSSMLRKFFSYAIPCVIICRGMEPPRELLEEARARDIAVYQSQEATTRFNFSAVNYLNRCIAPRMTQHGVLIDVDGVGVLITGESSVGKSEAALELVKRGHKLVADDVVDICRISDNALVGECPEMVRYLMEIRGIGIIDIRAMFGIGAVLPSCSIDLVMHMERWERGRQYDRLGLADETEDILGVAVPCQTLPVVPGRNVAIIIEVAARNLSLKKMGYSAARELDQRLNDMMMRRDNGLL